MATRPLTGRTVFFIVAGAFTVVISANLAMLFAATGSFPGLIVPNAYVASQDFDAQAKAQVALGWTAHASVDGGVLRVDLVDGKGQTLRPEQMDVVLGRPASDVDDRTLDLAWDGKGYAAPSPEASGQWRLKVSAVDGPDRYTATLSVYLPE